MLSILLIVFLLVVMHDIFSFYVLHLFLLCVFGHTSFFMIRCIHSCPFLSIYGHLRLSSGVVSLNTKSRSRNSPQSFVYQTTEVSNLVYYFVILYSCILVATLGI